MALNYNTLNSICREVLFPQLVNNIQYSATLFAIMYKKKQKWTGDDYQSIPIEYGENDNVIAYSGEQQLTVATKEIATKMRLPFRSYNNAIKLIGDDIDANKNAEKILSLVKAYMKNAEKTLKKRLADDIINGVGSSKEIDGIDEAVDTSAYAEIDPTDATVWQSGVDSTTTTLTKLVLSKAIKSVSFDGEEPDLIVTTKDIYAGLEDILEGYKRYVNVDSPIAKLGFKGIQYGNAEIIYDTYVPDGYLYILNTDYFKLFVLRDFSFIDFNEPLDYDYSVAHIRWKGNLFCTNRKMQYKFTALTAVSA